MGVVVPLTRTDNELKYNLGSVRRKKGSKKLYVDFPYNGVRIVKSTGLDDTPRNRARAREWLDRQMLRIEEGSFIFAKAFPGASDKEKAYHTSKEGREYMPEPHSIQFGEYVKSWQNKVMVNYPSEGKKRDYLQVIDDWLLPEFGDKTFYQINGVLLQEFLSRLRWRTGRKKGQRLSTSRIRNILIPLRTIWNDACEENRWNLPDPFRFIAKHVPKERKNQPVVLRYDEWQSILVNMNPYYRPVAEVMVMTGMIGSEVAGLRRQDILDGCIVVQNSIVRGQEKCGLKTLYRHRKIAITKSIERCLGYALANAKGGYVLTMMSGKTFNVDSFRKNVWTPALKKAGVDYKVPYTTRHTFCAWSLAIGVHPNRLVSLMGHGSKKMVYEIYGNYVEGLERDAERILNYFGEDFIGKKEAAISRLRESFGESGALPGDNLLQ